MMQEIERGKSLRLIPASTDLAYNSNRPRPGEEFTRRNVQICWNRNGIFLHYDRYVVGKSGAARVPQVFGLWPLAIIASILGIGAVGAAVTRDRPNGAIYRVTVAVPDKITPRAQAQFHDTTIKGKRAARHSLPTRAIATLRSPMPQPSGSDARLANEPQPTIPDNPASFSTQVAAVNAALSTGELQSWEDAKENRRGFVVVGPAQIDGNRSCRDVSILVRQDGSDNSVTKERRCS